MQVWRDERRKKERALKSRYVIEPLARIMRERNVSIEVMSWLRNNILLPTLTYESETWIWNRAQQSGVCGVEMSYLRGTCGVTRWEDESNENEHERCGMGPCANGVVWCDEMGEKKYFYVV